MGSNVMTTAEMRLAQLACVQRIEDLIDELEEDGADDIDLDALRAQAAQMRAHVEQALLDHDGEDRN